ncbi:hypothetical protein [Pleionea sp. CnH1-48]|uniref:hypothetical protein n=1 Tax=Pleionea sp. CnH1-48 TaxID=2954494 RepID=UPI002097FE09|nr:hypothetical protein [Pleionea sp. CnH1-48]MCO7223674.1 hypothetical protein [Pleionea sp. CnH1-48]
MNQRNHSSESQSEANPHPSLLSSFIKYLLLFSIPMAVLMFVPTPQTTMETAVGTGSVLKFLSFDNAEYSKTKIQIVSVAHSDYIGPDPGIFIQIVKNGKEVVTAVAGDFEKPHKGCKSYGNSLSSEKGENVSYTSNYLTYLECTLTISATSRDEDNPHKAGKPKKNTSFIVRAYPRGSCSSSKDCKPEVSLDVAYSIQGKWYQKALLIIGNIIK